MGWRQGMLAGVVKTGLRLLLGGVLLLVAAVVLQSPALRPAASSLVPAYPLVVLGGGLLLAWRFDRSRLVLALGLLLAVERTLAAWAPGGGERGRAIFVALSVLTPLSFGALAWLPERGLLARPVRIALAVAAAELGLVLLLCQPLLAPVVVAASPGRGVPVLGVAAFVLAGAVLIGRAVRQPTALEGGAVWALAAVFLALRSGARLDTSLYLATGGLILVVSLIETWHGMAYDDELTGLPARRALNEALGRLSRPYAVAMVDIDHFKRFNDEHGHDIGDQLLRMVGARLAGVAGGGRAYRYGGEEFAVLFPGQDVEQARGHVEALRRAIETTPFTLRAPTRPATRPEAPPPAADRRRITVTVSIGVAAADGGEASPAEIVRAADEALYRAKQAGRNRVCT